MKIKQISFYGVLSAGLLAAIVYSANYLLVDGIFSWHIRQREYQLMMLELLLIGSLLYFVIFHITDKRISLTAAGILFSGLLWLHMSLVPFIISGAYLFYLWNVGRCWHRLLGRQKKEDGWVAELLSGAAVMIVLFSFGSLIGVGTIRMVQLFVMLTALPVIWIGRYPDWKAAVSISAATVIQKWLILIVFMAMFVQAARMNISIDFDSAWYGLRTPYILENGRGIYENLGSIGVVYTYSKGYEVLTMPLSLLPSFGFIQAFNIWVTLLALAVCYKIGKQYLDSALAAVFTMLIAVIPGVMNMSITAKSDSFTLWVQLAMVYFVTGFAQKRTASNVIFASAALIFSWILKPTAIVFSTVIFGTAGGYWIWHRYRLNRIGGTDVGIISVFVLALAAMWGRTWLLTGVPVTSIYSGIFTKIGFQLKYPFKINTIPNTGAGLPVVEAVNHALKRLWGFFFLPAGSDMAHVILAWGGIGTSFFLILWIALAVRARLWSRRQERGKELRFLYILSIPFLIFSFLSLFRLYQVDGNYFMLFYIWSVLLGITAVGNTNWKPYQRQMKKLLAVLIMFNFLIMTLTNWAWSFSFTPIRVKHRGYYPHQKMLKEQVISWGNREIWELLEGDSRNRVIVVGEHPQMLMFPCSTQSYEDITGSSGNVELVKTMDRFIEFLEYASTDYIYMQAGYMKEHTRCHDLMRYLIENETLTNLYYENGNVLAQVDLSGRPGKPGQERLKEFDRNYILNGKQEE